MVFNGKFTRIIITGLLTGLLTLTVAFASSADTNVELDNVKAQLESYQSIMDTAHSMAEDARALGEAEDGVIIQTAKNYWHSAFDNYNALYPTYTELNNQYNQELKQEQEAQQKEKLIPLGTFRVSRYCSCSICNGGYVGTATGTAVTAGRTIAVDPSVIPLGSKVYIEGIGYRIAEDTGGAIYSNRIDLAVSSHSEAYRQGITYNQVYLVK